MSCEWDLSIVLFIVIKCCYYKTFLKDSSYRIKYSTLGHQSNHSGRLLKHLMVVMNGKNAYAYYSLVKKYRKQTQIGIRINSYYAREILLQEHLPKPHIFFTAMFLTAN